LPLPLDERRQAIVVRALPFGAFIVLLAVRGAVADWRAPDAKLDTRWLYALQAGVAGLLLLAWRTRYTELSTAPASARALLLSAGAGLAVLALWIAPLPSWTRMGSPAAAFAPVDARDNVDWTLVAVRALGAVIVVPVMEELFWRSFLMRWVDRRDFLQLPPASASLFAIGASSAVFALAHDRWFPGLVAGVVFARLYRRLGNLWYAIVAHAVCNLSLAVWVVGTRSWEYW
jgi:CAAX prenyl protease-like protein